MEALTSILLIVLTAYLLTRSRGTHDGPKSALEQKLEELSLTPMTDVSPDGELIPKSYRIQCVIAPGFEDHTLLLVCLDDAGYWSLHYDGFGNQRGVIYVPFAKLPDGPIVPVRETNLASGSTDSPKTASPEGGSDHLR